MSNFKRGGRFSGANYRKPSFGGGSDRDQQMFQATCGNCGKQCEVPFRPNGRKPVLCSDCFQKERSADNRAETRFGGERKPSYGDRGDRNNSRPSFGDRGPRPDYNSKPASVPNYKQDFEMLNAKLDKILRIINPQVPVHAHDKKAEKVQEAVAQVVETVKEAKIPEAAIQAVETVQEEVKTAFDKVMKVIDTEKKKKPVAKKKKSTPKKK